MPTRKELEDTIAKAMARLAILEKGAPVKRISGDAAKIPAPDKIAAFDKLHAQCLAQFKRRFAEDYCDDNDDRCCLWEAAMELCLGKGVFKVMNEANQ